MQKLTVIAIITAKAGFEERVREGLASLVAPTLQEEGCLNYDLHVDNENPAIFAFHENWESEDHLERHLQSGHIRAFQEEAGDWIENVQMHRLSPC